jgi:hypothetical protein
MSAVGVWGPPVPAGTAGGPGTLEWTFRGGPCRVGHRASTRPRPHGRLVENGAMSSCIVVSVLGNADELGES